MRLGASVFVTALLLAAAAPPAVGAPANEDTVREVAAGLRCVVCQSLSVADSPSETANQMRAIIRERLSSGETPEQVTAYFVDKYGAWILLAPPKRGFDLLVWVIPFAGLAVGLIVVVAALRRWTRRTAQPAESAVAVDPAMRERIAREMAESDHR